MNAQESVITFYVDTTRHTHNSRATRKMQTNKTQKDFKFVYQQGLI